MKSCGHIKWIAILILALPSLRTVCAGESIIPKVSELSIELVFEMPGAEKKEMFIKGRIRITKNGNEQIDVRLLRYIVLSNDKYLNPFVIQASKREWKKDENDGTFYDEFSAVVGVGGISKAVLVFVSNDNENGEQPPKIMHVNVKVDRSKLAQ